MKLKIKPTLPKSSTTELVSKGEFPSRANQFKPGDSWKGNAGGRPKAVRDLYQRLAEEKVKIKVLREDGAEEEIVVPKIEQVARTQFDIACKTEPHSVTAAREIVRIMEPAEGSTDRGNFDIAREVLILMIERGKHMEVRDI